MLIRLVDGVGNTSESNRFYAVIFIDYRVPDADQLLRFRMPARPKIANRNFQSLFAFPRKRFRISLASKTYSSEGGLSVEISLQCSAILCSYFIEGVEHVRSENVQFLERHGHQGRGSIFRRNGTRSSVRPTEFAIESFSGNGQLDTI